MSFIPRESLPDQISADRTSTIIFKISNQAQIPQDQLPQIFHKFYRVPGGDRWKQGGTGLGLALVQKLVEIIGGKIFVESSEGWTSFTVQLNAIVV